MRLCSWLEACPQGGRVRASIMIFASCVYYHILQEELVDVWVECSKDPSPPPPKGLLKRMSREGGDGDTRTCGLSYTNHTLNNY